MLKMRIGGLARRAVGAGSDGLCRWAKWGALAALVGGGWASAYGQTALEIYDAAVTADADNGLMPVATLTTPVTLNGGAGSAFDFGAVSGDATIEFIVEGNPGANNSAYLAVGSTTASSLRYEVWDNTGQLGFTLAGVADYQFTPGVASPAEVAHVAYVWDPATHVMKVYVNGSLAGTTTGVGDAFVMPSGAGKLGANESGEEGMVGKIHRVTVYDSAVSERTIRLHAGAFGAHVSKALAGYDAAVAADAGGGLSPLARLTTPVVLNGKGAGDFDFGASSGDVSIEFILEGDPTANNTAFLAVGENSVSSLRYELWDNTGQLGFTQGGVADYSFAPGVSSPTLPTHVTYIWNSETLAMKVYVNGQSAGAAANVSSSFSMPMGVGRIGNNLTGTEPMVGTVYRVTVYDDLLTDAAILRHAKAFTDVLRPPIIASFASGSASIAAGETATLTWDVSNALKVKINGVDRTSANSLAVSPEVSTSYTLTAENAFGKASSQVRVQVVPALGAYDAAITADAGTGLTPLAKLTTPVILNGTGGAPFDFGAASGDATLEFIVEGDPSVSVDSYLAVGENPDSNLRYEAWNNTGQLGFTQLRVADYVFAPPVPASTWPTHLAYVWDSAALTMRLYVNGTLAGESTGVSDVFTMPAGAGWLGTNPTGGESMVGAIFRVTAYPGQVPAATIHRHASAFLGAARPKLSAYDTAIDASATGGLTPAARLLAPVTLLGTGGVTFNFGATTGDGSIEFVLEGDPSINVSSFLAVGAVPASSLRFELWQDTGQLGFTQAGVADYQFTPGVPSPTTLSHVVYVLDPAAATMKLYVNGTLAGTVTGVDPAFVLPADLGLLGSNADASEAMAGILHRVTVYDALLAESAIVAHAKPFVSASQPPVLALEIKAGLPSLVLSNGVSGAHYRVEYRASLSAGDAWQVLVDIPSLSGTSVPVGDPTPVAGQTQRYYRAVLVP